jgi:hypothetical protein
MSPIQTFNSGIIAGVGAIVAVRWNSAITAVLTTPRLDLFAGYAGGSTEQRLGVATRCC